VPTIGCASAAVNDQRPVIQLLPTAWLMRQVRHEGVHELVGAEAEHRIGGIR
jgi:hypothetical protein